MTLDFKLAMVDLKNTPMKTIIIAFIAASDIVLMANQTQVDQGQEMTLTEGSSVNTIQEKKKKQDDPLIPGIA